LKKEEELLEDRFQKRGIERAYRIVTYPTRQNADGISFWQLETSDGFVVVDSIVCQSCEWSMNRLLSILFFEMVI